MVDHYWETSHGTNWTNGLQCDQIRKYMKHRKCQGREKRE
ncbi:7768_t:CDS:2 [Entrophospora sp. SA101]|nr:7768_t:CDS:2 [Entrophospora sp. SA101]